MLFSSKNRERYITSKHLLSEMLSFKKTANHNVLTKTTIFLSKNQIT